MLVALTILGLLFVMLQDEAIPMQITTTKHAATVHAVPIKQQSQGRLPNTSTLSFNRSASTEIPLTTRTLPPFRRFGADYECVGWRATRTCSPHGPLDAARDAGCETSIPGGVSGFCLYRHKHTHELQRALEMHCDSLSPQVAFDCAYAAELHDYASRSLVYSHDEMFAFDAIQRQARSENNETDLSAVSFERGIAFVVYGDILASAYASVCLLRQLGNVLPIEMWYKQVEVEKDHPLFVDLKANHGVLLREILDPFATDYYTKLYAVFYSTFNNVLLLDADNFASRDPTYLFDSHEFLTTGAVFWPDFWHPNSTIFNVKAHSVLWQALGIPFVDMFEQESAQVLVNRRRHLKALNMLMYYGFSLPRVHEEMVWGDKDLFRLAWLKTNSSFHMIATPPASAGTLQLATNKFCGLTMVQHDPRGEVVFLHRNLVKLRVDTLNLRVWTHLLQVKPGVSRDKYVIQWSKLYANIESCWGRTEPVETLEDFTVTPIDMFAFRDLESQILQYVNDAGAIIYHGLSSKL